MALPFLSCPDCHIRYDAEPYKPNCPVIHKNRLSCLDCKKDEQQVAEFLIDFLKQPNLRRNREPIPGWEALGPLKPFSCRSCTRELSPVGAEPYIFEGCYHLTCRSCDTSKCACGFSYGWARKCGLDIFEKVGRFRAHEAKLAARQKEYEQGIIAQLKKAKPECAMCGFYVKTPLVAMTCEHVVCIQCREDVRHLDVICDVCRKPKKIHMAWGQKLLREEEERVAAQEKAAKLEQEKVAAQETDPKTMKQEQEKAEARVKPSQPAKQETKAMTQDQRQFLAQIGMIEMEIRKRLSKISQDSGVVEDDEKPEANSEFHSFRAELQRLADTIDDKRPEPEVGPSKARENEIGFKAPKVGLPAEVRVDELTKEVAKLRTELDELKLVIGFQALEQVKLAAELQRQQVPTKSGIRTLKETCVQKIIEVKKAESAGESDGGDFEVLNLKDFGLTSQDRITNI